ncbi:MAG: hypothetical protein KIT84_01505 [Labilithrix sp.]|nr:hypothetical protein [Labilithrix sp.]MCW5809663.1 hypothetical protein [Labilithrix sp.]
MALARLLALVLLVPACTDPAPARVVTPDLATKPTRPPGYTVDEAAKWGKFHSKRFNLTVPLPDGKVWRIDDHREPELVAFHEPTQTGLRVRATIEEGLMNRQRCEDRARALGIVPTETKTFTTVEDSVWVGPEAYDSRVWVAIEAAKPGAAVMGHVYLFGSFIRNCLIVHLSTSVPTDQDHEVLATRLAVAEERIVKAITLDPPRTTTDAELPKEKPAIHR